MQPILEKACEKLGYSSIKLISIGSYITTYPPFLGFLCAAISSKTTLVFLAISHLQKTIMHNKQLADRGWTFLKTTKTIILRQNGKGGSKKLTKMI